MYILIPGRHHVVTNFQFQYLFRLIHSGLEHENSQSLLDSNEIEGVIFAVTSANHQGTRRNPLSFAYRAMAIQDFGRDLPIPVYNFPVEDIGFRDDFAEYTLKSILHSSDGQFNLTPENCLVVCATKVAELYKKLNFSIYTAEQEESNNPLAVLPWEIIETIAKTPNWQKDNKILNSLHPASYRLFTQYNLGKRIQFLFNDPIISDDGDITTTRDYSSYIRQMDEIAHIKWGDVAPFVQSGRIGDIGCSTGSWLKLASEDLRFAESDFYGIEITRQLYQLCQQRKDNREFKNPNIWFSQKNAVTGLVFQKNTMNTIHTSSLTHEIESYGSHKDLLQFIKNRFNELQPGGVWINRDVIGPEDKAEQILLYTNSSNGKNCNPIENAKEIPQEKLHEQLEAYSTTSLFRQFARDFRRSEGLDLKYTIETHQGIEFFKLTKEHACEFLLTKDYLDNWQSEMHERFCFWSYSDWCNALEEAGFEILSDSKAFTNQWIAENRFNGKVTLCNTLGAPLPYPPTNMIIIARKPF